MGFILLMFKYFDKTFCTLGMLESPVQSWVYFSMIDCKKGKAKNKRKINGGGI